MQVTPGLLGQNLRCEMRCRKHPGRGQQAIFAVERIEGFTGSLLTIVDAVLGSGEGEVFAVQVRGAPGGTLWNHAQGHRFGSPEFRRSFVEIQVGGRADTLDVMPVGSEVEIRFQELRLGVVAFQFQGDPHLVKLAVDRARPQAETQTRQLHGNR